MPTPRLRQFWTLLILICEGAAASMFVAGQWAWHRSLDESDSDAAPMAPVRARSLAQRIDRYRTLPEVLA